MDVRRISLIAALAIVSYLMILQWSKDYSTSGPEATAASVIAGEITAADASEIPVVNAAESSDVPATAAPTAATDKVQVMTDTLDVVIDLRGGDIIYASLPQYPLSITTPDIPFKILENDKLTYLAQSGLVGENGIDTQGRAQYTVEQSKYQMNDGQPLEVVLTHMADNGLLVKKVFTFSPDSYLIDVRFDLQNQGTDTLRTNVFAQLRRDNSADPSSTGGVGMRSYLGATFSTTDSSYEKVKFKDLDDDKFSKTSVGGWVAILQHYFLSAWVPASNDTNKFYGQKGSNGDYYAGFTAPTLVVGPGESISAGAQLYVGPKDQDALAEIAANLEKTVDYGWLWWVAEPIFWLLQLIQSVVGNWGWSIVFLTLLIKTVLFPLTASSYKSMAKMRKFAPKIQELRDQFGDDRQKMSQEMMKLYQKEKLNPLGGCLPMLLQMPIFIALYWVLMESVELRQSPFMFWIVDLSIKDPYFVLPLLMGASMFFQMRMQQQPTMDPMQAKIMQFMPVMFTFMFLWFPAGLTLYWFVNNVTTITQQYLVNRSIDRADAKTAS
ncbi:MAG: membrane protein insertase YidC [Reinekea sp.]|nr:membrane protein insertase YidC [Reinekea sp.]